MTDLIKITNQPPAYLQNLGYVDSGLGAGITPKAPKLGITQAKEFTITRDGQKMILPEKTVRCIMVASASSITKAWYSKSFTPGSNETPDCFSDDGKLPAPGVKMKQSNNCVTCPKNAFGSHPTTGRGKACSDRKRVVLVWEGDPETLMTFNVPTMSMQSLRRIDDQLKQANIPPQAVLLSLSFDPGYTYPVVQMGAVGFVDEATAKRLIALKDSDEVTQLLRETDSEDTGVAPAQEETKAGIPAQVIPFGKTAQSEPEPEVEVEAAKPKRTRRTKAEMEAARAAENPQTPDPAFVEEVAEEVTAQQAGTPSNVLDMINAWKSK